MADLQRNETRALVLLIVAALLAVAIVSTNGYSPLSIRACESACHGNVLDVEWTQCVCSKPVPR